MKKIIETLTETNNEGTRAPYWAIVNPVQNMSCDVHVAASQFTGPFFCREDATDYLNNRRHYFSKRAVVYCFSGCFSYKYNELWETVKILKKNKKV